MKISVMIISLVLVVGILISSCSPAAKKKNIISSKADSIDVFALKKELLIKKLSIPAELTPIERTDLYAKVSGYVKEFKVDLGDRVRKGEVLVELDAPEIISNYELTNSAVQSAQSKYLTSLDNFKRMINASKVEGTIAPGELERIKYQMLADSSLVEAAKSKLRVNAQLKNYMTICAPFNGIVTHRYADPGMLTGINNTIPLLVIENINVLRLRISVPGAYSSAIPDTSLIEFSVDAAPGKTYKAVLSRKSGSIDLSTRTEIWEYIYQNFDNQLKSGMFANATIKLGRDGLSFLVPAAAIVTNLEKRFVIRLTEGIAEWVEVKKGFSQNDKIEIFGSLHEGDLLLAVATDELKPGTKLIGKQKKN